MKKCCYRKIALVTGCVFIALAFVMGIGGIVIGFTESSHMEYLVFGNSWMGNSSVPFAAIHNKLLCYGGGTLFLFSGVYLIFKVRQNMMRYILFDENKVIFVFSKYIQYEYRWRDISPEHIEMKWVSSKYVNTQIIEFNIPSLESEFLIPSQYKNFKELKALVKKRIFSSMNEQLW
ncbi:hypothetical protein [Amedibacillus sp. YH-ame10]